MGMSTPLAHQIKEKKLGDCTYRVEPLGAIDGKKAFIRLGNVIGPALHALKLAPGSTAEETIGAFAGALGGLLSNLKYEDLEYFEKLFSPKTTVVYTDDEGRERSPLLKDLPDHFAPAAGRFDQYIPWLVHALDVSFGEVFRGAWRANVAKLSGAIKASS